MLRRGVVGAPEHAHYSPALVEVPESDITAEGRRGGHDAVLPAILTRSLTVASERDAGDGRVVGPSVQPQDGLVCEHILYDQRPLGVGDGEQGQGRGGLKTGNGAAVWRRRENGVNQLARADVPDLDPTIFPSDKDLVEEGRHVADAAGQLVVALLSCGREDGRVVLEGGRLPHFYPRLGAGNDPGSKNEDLLDGLVQVGGHLQLGGLLAALEGPQTLGFAILRVAPGSKDLLLPSIGGGDVGGGLGTGNEDEVEAALEVVSLQGSADGRCDLEGGFAEGDRSEGHAGGRHESYGLHKLSE